MRKINICEFWRKQSMSKGMIYAALSRHSFEISFSLHKQDGHLSCLRRTAVQRVKKNLTMNHPNLSLGSFFSNPIYFQCLYEEKSFWTFGTCWTASGAAACANGPILNCIFFSSSALCLWQHSFRQETTWLNSRGSLRLLTKKKKGTFCLFKQSTYPNGMILRKQSYYIE